MIKTFFEDLTPYKKSYYEKISELQQLLERAKNYQYLLSGEQKQLITNANEAIKRFKILSNTLENEIGKFNYFNSKSTVKQSLIDEQNIVEEISKTIKNMEMEITEVAFTTINPVWQNDQLQHYEVIFKWSLKIDCEGQVINSPKYVTQTVITTNLDKQRVLYSICRNEFNFLSQIPQFSNKLLCLNPNCHFQILIAKKIDIISEKIVSEQIQDEQQFQNTLIKIYIKQLAINSIIIKKGNQKVFLKTNEVMELSKDCEIIIFSGLSYFVDELFIFQTLSGQN